MKQLTLLILLFCFSCKNKQLVIKELNYPNLRICWYRESYISSTRAFVKVEQDGKTDIVLSCNDSDITDIGLSGDTIVVKIFNLKEAAIYGKLNKIDKYVVALKNATYEEWFKHYHRGQKFHPVKGL